MVKGERYSVLHLIDIFDVRWERDQQRIVCLQLERGHDVTVVTSNYNDNWRRDTQSSFAEWEGALNVTGVHHNLAVKPPLFNVVVYLPSPQLMDRYDIIHAYGPWSYSSYLACVLKRITKTPLVIRADFGELAYKQATKSFFWRSLLLAQFKHADVLTAYTLIEKERLSALGIPDKKINLVPSGVNLAKFHKAASRKAIGDEVVVGYMGRFVEVKGVHRIVSPLCKLLREYDHIKVLFAGPIQDRAYFDHNVTELYQFANFSYIGSVAPDRFFNQCDIVLVPSISEAGATLVREAMASGRALVASDIGPIRALITHGVSGLLAETQQDFYEGCRRLVEDSCLRESLQKEALHQSAQYSDCKMVDEIEEIYNAVITSK